MSKTTYWKIAIVVAVALPSLLVRLTGIALEPVHAIVVFGSGVVAASFLLAWAAEAELSIGATDRGRTLDNESV